MKKIKYLIVILLAGLVIFGAFSFTRKSNENKDVLKQKREQYKKHTKLLKDFKIKLEVN